MKIACVLATHLPIKAELARRPELPDRPVVIVGEQGARRFVLDHSPQARGVSRGMPLQEARSICQEAVLLEADQSYYQAAFDQMLQALEQRSPLVEAADLGCAYVGLDGLEPMYGGEARLTLALLQAVPAGYNPRVGVAPGKFPAYLAAATSGAGRATRVSENVMEFLDRFSINLLPISWEGKARLFHLGLHNLGQIARQPVGAMQAQLGLEGLRAWELSRGTDRHPLIPRKSEEVVRESLTFPSPVVTLSGILLAAESLLVRAFARKEARGKYARSITLESQVLHHPPWVRHFAYKQAVGSAGRALFVIKNSLESVSLPGPLEDLQLTLLGLTGESGIQGNLFADVRKQEQLRETVRQLQVRWGGSIPIYQVRDFQPWSPIPERQKVLVQLDP
jgi:DNA polymerase IV